MRAKVGNVQLITVYGSGTFTFEMSFMQRTRIVVDFDYRHWLLEYLRRHWCLPNGYTKFSVGTWSIK